MEIMETRKYQLRPGKPAVKQSYYLFDENEETVYEANILKMPVFGAADVEFINHVTGRSSMHKVGHTVTTETSGLFGGPLFAKSHFKFDDVKIWDYLHEQGIRIDTGLQGGKLGASYSVTLEGNPIATIDTASIGGSFITTKYALDVTTTEEYLDWAFLVAWSIARTEQTILQ